MSIHYSMCWEDPSILLSALNISKKDEVLSIGSAGENVFSLLLKDPKRIVAIDLNYEQIFLLKMKIVAIQNLNFDEFVEFIGFKDSSRRLSIYQKLKNNLSISEVRYWDNRPRDVANGIIHCGKFERYLRVFRKFILPVIISRKKLANFLSSEKLKIQKEFFTRYLDTLRFKLLFKIFFSKAGLSYGRDKAYFRYSEQKDLSKYYFEKAKRALKSVFIGENYFVYYILKGSINLPLKQHPYLDKSNFNRLKALVNKIEIVRGDIYDYLKKTKESSFSKYNLSDIFESMSQNEYEMLLREIVRVSKRKSLACYWNNLAPRYKHEDIRGITQDWKTATDLFDKDRIPFYSKFILEKIKFNK